MGGGMNPIGRRVPEEPARVDDRDEKKMCGGYRARADRRDAIRFERSRPRETPPTTAFDWPPPTFTRVRGEHVYALERLSVRLCSLRSREPRLTGNLDFFFKKKKIRKSTSRSGFRA